MKQSENEEWVCWRCGKKFYFSEKYNFGEKSGPDYCYSCYEDMLDRVRTTEISRANKEKTYTENECLRVISL